MVQHPKWSLSRIEEVIAFGDAPDECREEMRNRYAEIIHEAGDRAAGRSLHRSRQNYARGQAARRPANQAGEVSRPAV